MPPSAPPSVTETDPAGARARLVVAATPALPALDPEAYEIEHELARGGMGRILRARDRRLDRVVAIKELLVASPARRALFEREVRLTARLQHPSIVTIYEAGILPGGDLVYAMRFVPGRPLREVLRGLRSTADRLARLPLILAVADALAYAHREGVIHRDLKPSNILVGEFGEVVVIDWGLARELGADDAEPGGAEAALPRGEVTAAAMGTPAYMAPEAVRGDPVDARADVHAIGAILYELLAGHPAYDGADAPAILAAVRAGRPPRTDLRRAGIPADLVAIVDTAMARRADDRYPSARELADELRRFLTGQLVAAHVYSRRERALRLVRRHPALVVLAAAALVVAGLSVVALRHIVIERDRTAERADRLTIAQAQLELDRDPVASLRTLAALPPRSPQWRAARVLAADALARGVAHPVAGGEVLAVAVDPPRAARRDATGVLIAGGDGATAAGPGAAAAAVVLSADGATIATIEDDRLAVWRVGAARPILTRPAPRAGARLALASDGSAVAMASRDRGVQAWTVADGVERTHAATTRDVAVLAVAPAAAWLVTAHDNQVEVHGERERHHVLADEVTALAVGADGAIVAGTRGGAVRIDDGARALDVRVDGAVTAVALEPSGDRFAAASDRTVVVWRRDGRRERNLHGAAAPLTSLAIAADGRTVVAGGARGAWRWTATDGDEPAAGVATLTTCATGAVIAAGSDDGSVLRLDGTTPRRLGAHAAPVRAVAVAPGSGRIASAGDDGSVRLWDPDPRVVGMHRAAALAVAWDPDGRVLASGGADHAVRLWPIGGEGRVVGQHAGPVIDVRFTADGRWLASIADEPVAMLWPLVPGLAARRLDHHAAVTALAVDGTRVVTGTRGGEVTMWSLRDGRPRLLVRHDGPVRAVALGPDGEVASASDDGTAWYVDRHGRATRLRGHEDFVRRVRVAPDGRRVLTVGEDATVRLWDPTTGTGRALTTGRRITDAVFDRDGWVVAVGAAGDIHRWPDELPHDATRLRRHLRELIAALEATP